MPDPSKKIISARMKTPLASIKIPSIYTHSGKPVDLPTRKKLDSPMDRYSPKAPITNPEMSIPLLGCGMVLQVMTWPTPDASRFS